MADEMVKTTIEIPKALWRRARVRAAQDDSDFRSTVIRALELYLATGPEPRRSFRQLSPEEAARLRPAFPAKSKKGGKS